MDQDDFFDFFVCRELSNFKEGKVNTSSKNSITDKSSKGSSAIDMRDEKTKKRIKKMQKSSTCRAVLAFLQDTMTAQKTVLQKLSTMCELIDDIANTSDEDEDGSTAKSVPESQQTKKESDKQFFQSKLGKKQPSSISSVATNLSSKIFCFNFYMHAYGRTIRACHRDR